MAPVLPPEILKMIVKDVLESCEPTDRDAFIANARNLAATNKTMASFTLDYVLPVGFRIALKCALPAIERGCKAITAILQEERANSIGQTSANAQSAQTGPQPSVDDVDQESVDDDVRRQTRFCKGMPQLSDKLEEIVGPSARLKQFRQKNSAAVIKAQKARERNEGTMEGSKIRDRG